VNKRNPRVLLLDNSPRHLGGSWFGKWFRKIGCRVSVRHFGKLGRPLDLDRFETLVISGSPASATEDRPWILKELDLIEGADELGMPILGVCFGAQLLARAYYGKEAIQSSPQPEFGWYRVQRTPQQDPLFEDMPEQFTSFQYHTEAVLPQPDMQVLATSEPVTVQAFRVDSKLIWGIQFHLEVTPQAGRDLLRRTRTNYEPYGFRYEELIARAKPSEAAPKLFENFLRALPE
jgi:GMP synthase-like glutamine amidotransferase